MQARNAAERVRTAGTLDAGDEQLQDAHQHDLVRGRIGHLEPAVRRGTHDGHDRSRLARRVGGEQAGHEEGAHCAECPLCDHTTRILLANGV